MKSAGLKPRSLYQTRHNTFATLMLDAGELPGLVQKMMGHASLKMILERYYSYIKNYQRDDGLPSWTMSMGRAPYLTLTLRRMWNGLLTCR